MQEVSELVSLLQQNAGGVFVVFVRLSAFFALLPAFGEQSVPTRVKLIIVLALTMVVFPAVAIDHSDARLPILIASEVVTGVLFGLGMRLMILGLQTAGTIAAQATSLSQLLGGNGADPLPAMGHILIVSALALAAITGLHVKAAQFFILTYELVPAGQFPKPDVFSHWGIRQVAQAFTLGFALAAPFVILSVIYNLALGAINKAMPQLMVAFVGAPLITAGGLFLLFLTAPLILAAWLEALENFMSSPMQGTF